MNPGKVTLAANLVKYLRRGVKRELAGMFLILAVHVNTVLDPETYYKALSDLYDAHALLEAVGLTDDPERLEGLRARSRPVATTRTQGTGVSMGS